MNKSKKHLLKSLAAVFLFIFLINTNEASAQLFKDVPNSNPHANDIERLTNLGVISGYGNGYFGINDSIKREHAILMIYKVLKNEINPVRTYKGFKDVPTNHPNYAAIKWGYEANIIDGMGSDGTFSPGTFITREQMAKILVNAFKLKTSTKAAISDVSNTRWSYESVNTLQANGITFLDNGKFNPTGQTTRGQMASFLIRAIDKTGVSLVEDITPIITTPAPSTPTKPVETPIEGENVLYDSGFDMKWKVVEGLTTLHMKGYSDNKMVGEFVKGQGKSLQGISIGMTRQQVINAKSGKFTNVIQFKDGRYRVEADEDPQKMKQKLIIDENGMITTVFLDNHQGDRVTGILSIEKSKYAEKPYYYPYSQQLRESYESLMVILINQSRKEFNLPTLTNTPEWNFIARKHSKDMIDRNYFDHVSPDGGTLGSRFDAGKLRYTMAAENISYGYETVIHAHEGFMNSAGHRKNVLHASPTKVFVGAEFSYKSSDLNTVYYTVNFYKQ